MGMLDYKNRQVGKLSGGEQQRVFIARALVSEPRLLLLDEPTASVDPTMQTEFYELLERLKEQMAIVLLSHDISAISIYVDKIACLNRQLFYHGSKEIGPEVLEATYKCPVQMIAHGTVPHRVLREH
jgi:zinc transport system ATP-binding protein